MMSPLAAHRGRERLVRQRTMLVNAVRGHLAEFGVIAPQGLRNVGKLIAVIRDAEVLRAKCSRCSPRSCCSAVVAGTHHAPDRSRHASPA